MQDLAYEFSKIFQGWYTRTLTAGGATPSRTQHPGGRGERNAPVLGPKPLSSQLFSRGCAPEPNRKNYYQLVVKKHEHWTKLATYIVLCRRVNKFDSDKSQKKLRRSFNDSTWRNFHRLGRWTRLATYRSGYDNEFSDLHYCLLRLSQAPTEAPLGLLWRHALVVYQVATCMVRCALHRFVVCYRFSGIGCTRQK